MTGVENQGYPVRVERYTKDASGKAVLSDTIDNRTVEGEKERLLSEARSLARDSMRETDWYLLRDKPVPAGIEAARNMIVTAVQTLEVQVKQSVSLDELDAVLNQVSELCEEHRRAAMEQIKKIT